MYMYTHTCEIQYINFLTITTQYEASVMDGNSKIDTPQSNTSKYVQNSSLWFNLAQTKSVQTLLILSKHASNWVFVLCYNKIWYKNYDNAEYYLITIPILQLFCLFFVSVNKQSIVEKFLYTTQKKKETENSHAQETIHFVQ